MSTPNGPQSVFCVGFTRVSEAGISLAQDVTQTLVDHRGLLEMPAYAVMAESVTSGAYWYTFAEPVATVQSWLAMTAGARPKVGDRLQAVSAMAHHDDAHGTATMTITNGSHEVVCSGVARAVRVGRSTEALRALDKDAIGQPVETLPTPPDVDTTVSAIDPDWDGRRILTAISRGQIARGPLCELLAMTVDLQDEPVMTVEPQQWMANPLGAIQGGVIASLIGQACSLAGQAHTGPGDRYTLADLSVFYFRSPPVDGRSLTLATTTERVGRRMGTVSATMSDAGGTDYVRAVANVAYERSSAF
ncbi:acyl-coenzyme A thioesterase PaaI-like protein [Mycolicibacterium sp. BK556]|uniref:PaaI family thioesterase n=1 Tax=unclassified Mycolicibacterium TaxID=2636767 RepID=UPI0016127DB9|nr:MULTISPECIES: PaaI family thioesterase [unclassified Mycolicibacterium]MBB3602245.1 acyl-coenzyme A thioesterase PaaI-like protein [Mycolicibacterium sp. BK556]MBB3631997.1 acyl-coenzyme A thioesterase PaaI-like protein [Mycolicibacterium sp. BK607]MBB3750015.1 acyl-coenzyme A thioesterase PaaI-like protein [Mycolicibacterium sp. BK634]